MKAVSEGVYTRGEVEEGEETVMEPQKTLPVHARCEVGHGDGGGHDDDQVLVVGGGPSGLSAALAARRAGAEVILMERWGREEVGGGVGDSY